MKKIAYVLIVVGLLLIVNSLIHSIIDLWNKQDLVSQAQQELNSEKNENSKLKGELKVVQTRGFIESQARNKLFMEKPGETEVILPENQDSDSSSSNSNSSDAPNYQKWINLFFPS